jgi:hypothetical protein
MIEKNIVYITKDYDNFKLAHNNRPIVTKGKKFTDLENSILRCGELMVPIIIDDNFIIAEGQHRWYICRKHGIPIKYIYVPGSSKELHTLNSQKTWSLENFIHYYNNNPSYIKLAALQDSTGLSLNALHALLTGKEIKAVDFSKGNFVLSSSDLSNFSYTWPKIKEILNHITINRPGDVKKFKKTRVISTLGRFVNLSKFNLESFLNKISTAGAIMSVNDQQSAEEMLINIYNKNRQKGKLYFI